MRMRLVCKADCVTTVCKIFGNFSFFKKARKAEATPAYHFYNRCMHSFNICNYKYRLEKVFLKKKSGKKWISAYPTIFFIATFISLFNSYFWKKKFVHYMVLKTYLHANCKLCIRPGVRVWAGGAWAPPLW